MSLVALLWFFQAYLCLSWDILCYRKWNEFRKSLETHGVDNEIKLGLLFVIIVVAIIINAIIIAVIIIAIIAIIIIIAL